MTVTSCVVRTNLTLLRLFIWDTVLVKCPFGLFIFVPQGPNATKRSTFNPNFCASMTLQPSSHQLVLRLQALLARWEQ
jgi:hypothetical protein